MIVLRRIFVPRQHLKNAFVPRQIFIGPKFYLGYGSKEDSLEIELPP